MAVMYAEPRIVGPQGIPLELMGSLKFAWSPEEGDTAWFGSGGQRVSPTTLSTSLGGKWYQDVKYGLRQTPQNAMNPRGLLEGERINRNIRSQEFDDAGWSKLNASISENATAAPDGTTTADEIIEDSASAAHMVTDQNANIPAVNTDCAVSCWMKANTRNFGALSLGGTGFNDAPVVSFDLITGVATNIGGEPHRDSYMIQYPNNWWRCVMIVNSDSSGLGFLNRIGVHDGSGAFAYQGDGSSSIYLWGIQSEFATLFETSYGPTTSAAVTRAADDFDFSSTGILSAAQGTVIVGVRPQFAAANLGTNAIIFDSRVASNDDGLVLYHRGAANAYAFLVRSGGADEALIDSTTVAVRGAVAHVAGSWITNEAKLFLNGLQEGSTDTSVTVPAAVNANAFVGQSSANVAPWFGSVEFLHLFDRPLTDNEFLRHYHSTRPYIDGRALPW